MICPHCNKLILGSNLKKEIMEILEDKKEIYFRDVQKELKKKKLNYQYAGVMRHLWNLEKEGLIEVERKENMSGKPCLAKLHKDLR